MIPTSRKLPAGGVYMRWDRQVISAEMVPRKGGIKVEITSNQIGSNGSNIAMGGKPEDFGSFWMGI